MTQLSQMPLFYVGIYLMTGLLWAIWRWDGSASSRMHALGKQRFGRVADFMLLAPVLLWPISILFSVLRLLRLLPSSWTIKVKDRACKCGGAYHTQRVLVDNAGVVGKLIVKCMKCKELAELWDSVDLEDPESKG